MSGPETGRAGKRGTLVIPPALRRRFGLNEGALIIAEERPDGILIRSAIATETYTPERKAAFLLENAVDAGDYASAREAVRRMGLDPARVPHGRPTRERKASKARKTQKPPRR
jgi:bifunctional DNA-binding transcriptional regulator/antitoxin component of YhaV-PrlF toxin-antitoxin module